MLMRNLDHPLRIVLLIIALLCASIAIADDFVIDGIYYYTSQQDYFGNQTDEFAIACYCDKNCSNLVIPNVVTSNGRTYSVKEIRGFDDNSSIINVVIGDSVQMIRAFDNCPNLSTLTIGKSVRVIHGFDNCNIKKLIYKADNLEVFNYYYGFPFRDLEQVEICDNVETLPYYFCNETKISQVVIPASIKKIENAFNDCINLTSVTIFSPHVAISYAFRNCSNLRNAAFTSSTKRVELDDYSFYRCGFDVLTIPASIIKIGNGCFTGCSNLQSIKVVDGNQYYDSRDNCNAIINTETNKLLAGCMNTVIPNSVSEIGASAFSYCSNLTNIDIPYSVMKIGPSAFGNCNNLTNIELPESVKEINGSFHDTGLRSVVIPNSVKVISDGVLHGIGEIHGAFANCKQLTSVIIGDSVEFIDAETFLGCESLTDIKFSEEVKIVVGGDYGHGQGTFLGTPWYENQPDGMVYIGRAAYHYLGTMPQGTEFCLQEGTISISDDAFSNYDTKDHDCSGLTGIVFPKSLRWIGADALSYCQQLTEIEIPDSVIMLSRGAFNNCIGLKNVTIGKGLKVIEAYAFGGCENLTSVTCLATSPPMMKKLDDYPYNYILSNGQDDENIDWDDTDNCFDENTYTNATLYVPKGYENAYRSANGWKKFIHIVGITVSAGASDVNGDGEVNIADINNMVDAILSGDNDKTFDVNGDGEIGIADINEIVQTILGSN